MSVYSIEICCGSADDVIEAAKAGANRVELNSNLFQGGLTPTVGTLRTVKKNTDIPVMCMVRPREGGFCYTPVEYEVMLADAEILLENGADGLVFGFLDETGKIDGERCAQIVKLAKGKSTVFHRAIDVVSDWRHTLDVLIELGVTRVLTSGQKSSVLAGIGVIRDMISYARGRIEILPGGDITSDTAGEIMKAAGVSWVHLALLKSCLDPSVRNNSSIHYGGALYPPEDVFQMTDADAVKSLRKSLEG